MEEKVVMEAEMDENMEAKNCLCRQLVIDWTLLKN
jgi:hypothetical protein